jgi:hypothetical protein
MATRRTGKATGWPQAPVKGVRRQRFADFSSRAL